MDGKSFDEVLGSALTGELERENARIENERRAREALRKEQDAYESRKTMTTSEMVTGALAEGEKALESVRRQTEVPKEKTDAAPPRPAKSAFPPPPSAR